MIFDYTITHIKDPDMFGGKWTNYIAWRVIKKIRETSPTKKILEELYLQRREDNDL